MLGTSSSETAGQTSGTSTNNMTSTKLFPCNTCELVFTDSPSQRTHMREPWHVYNLKRRMASLSPISADTYNERVATTLVYTKRKSSDNTASSATNTDPTVDGSSEESDDADNLTTERIPNHSCLFCITISDSPETNLEHMSSEHGLYIPEVERLSSLETTIGYLHTIVMEYNECLYCGLTKQSTEGIRRHMLDKGHCMINLEREPELLEFWDLSDSDKQNSDDDQSKTQTKRNTTRAKDSTQGEYTLPSGKVVGSKSKAREARLSARRTASNTPEISNQRITEGRSTITDLIPSTTPSETPRIPTQLGNQTRTVAVRDAAGLIGVSDQQLRSLFAVEKKAQRQQAVVRASMKWADELGGTHQKHYKQKMNLRDG